MFIFSTKALPTNNLFKDKVPVFTLLGYQEKCPPKGGLSLWGHGADLNLRR